jgi:hypothetical protein
MNAPVSDLDPFSEAFLRDPYPAYRELREAGAVVLLERYDAFGPRNRLFEESAKRLDGVNAWIAEMCELESLAPDGLGAAIYEQAPRCGLAPDAAGLVVRSLLSAGIDTTAHISIRR